MISRNNILARLRKGEPETKKSSLPKIIDSNLYKDYPENNNLLADLFKTNLEKLAGEFYEVSNKTEAAEQLLSIIKKLPENSCLLQKNELTAYLIKNKKAIQKYISKEDNNIDSARFACFESGITAADFLIARTGSILLNSLTAGGRRLSVLPPLHIVIAEKSQLVFSLDDGLVNLKNLNKNWSYATMITGPSRTSDIEKQLVLGAHGPKRLVVILINNNLI